MFITSVNNTGDKLFTSGNDIPPDKLSAVSLLPPTDDKFIVSSIDTKDYTLT
jgi:hypothetical protein